jgi:hypothetical protein
VRFVFDKNLPPQLARAINCLAQAKDPFEAHPLNALYPGRAADEVWMRELGLAGEWVALSIDVAIKQRAHEVAAWAESGLPFIFLEGQWGQLSYWAKAHLLVFWWPTLLREARALDPGAGIIVPCSKSLNGIRAVIVRPLSATPMTATSEPRR